MKKFFWLIIIFMLSACTLKTTPYETMHLLEIGSTYNLSCNIRLSEIKVADYLNTEKMVYRDAKGMHYFALNKWACSFSCIIKQALINSFPSIYQNQGKDLSIYILSFEPYFKNEKKGEIRFKAIVKLENNVKTFYIEHHFDVQNFEELVFRMNKTLDQFLRDLYFWIEENC
ncbi:hypothetical protein [Thermodesulfobacterium hydrogeniphilum]|uniref:hypothetical protein n=1 Tax=Thermodesulfobacterium hydrogeniphilum TaxID=161156 RepID=UPI0005717984|nr:hypothetical protein [Thermodesulfobacterium hydrogeniphilum]